MITYLCAKMLDELIVAAVISCLLACILWFGVGFPGEWVLFWLVYLTTLAIGIGVSRAVPSLLPVLCCFQCLPLGKLWSAAGTCPALPYAEGCTAGVLQL